ncbi:MAG TPA: IclR family transcriptional regulator [Burkholderiales bacterium]
MARRAPAAGKAAAPPTTEITEGVRSVGRALEILQAFAPGDADLAVAELLKRVKLSRPTLYRLLATLEQHGYLTSSGEPQRFRLGPAVAQLAHAWSASMDLATVARPIMQKVWRATEETVALFVVEGQFRVCLEEIESPQPLSFRRGIGYRERLVRGASGRCVLAHMNLSEAELREYARGQRIDLARYPQEFAAIRKRGYATSKNELIHGAVAIAAPFFNGAGQPAGALGVFGPSVRLSLARADECGRLLVPAAAELTRMLGGANKAAPGARYADGQAPAV